MVILYFEYMKSKDEFRCNSQLMFELSFVLLDRLVCCHFRSSHFCHWQMAIQQTQYNIVLVNRTYHMHAPYLSIALVY